MIAGYCFEMTDLETDTSIEGPIYSWEHFWRDGAKGANEFPLKEWVNVPLLNWMVNSFWEKLVLVLPCLMETRIGVEPDWWSHFWSYSQCLMGKDWGIVNLYGYQESLRLSVISTVIRNLYHYRESLQLLGLLMVIGNLDGYWDNEHTWFWIDLLFFYIYLFGPFKFHSE